MSKKADTKKEKDTTKKNTILKKTEKKVAKKATKPAVTEKEKSSEDKFAVVEIKGSQVKVYEGKKYEIDFVEGEKGAEVVLDKVLLFSERNNVKLGKPYINKAKVTAIIDSQKKGEKINGLKYKSKSRYRRSYGHRALVTRLLVKEISA